MAKNNKIALSDSLQAFDIVLSKGHHIDHHYEYQGLKAWHDFDGYTCYIGYKDLTLTLLFHGRYTVDFQQQETLKAFLSKVNKLLASKL
jgi:hypothetical protein